MTSRFMSLAPRPVATPSLVVTAPRPAYRAPRPVIAASLRPRAVLGGSSLAGVTPASDPYAAATATVLTPPGTVLTQPGATAPTADSCGCRP